MKKAVNAKQKTVMPFALSSVKYKIIKGYPCYRVGTDGSVWSRWKRGQGKGIMGKEWKKLKPGLSMGYPSVCLCDGNCKKWHKVHKLVLNAFSPAKQSGLQCAHKNSIRTDNRIENIRWVTQSENERDKVDLCIDNKGSRNGMAKLNEQNVIEIRKRHAKKLATSPIAKFYRVSEATIRSVILQKTWKHV